MQYNNICLSIIFINHFFKVSWGPSDYGLLDLQLAWVFTKILPVTNPQVVLYKKIHFGNGHVISHDRFWFMFQHCSQSLSTTFIATWWHIWTFLPRPSPLPNLCYHFGLNMHLSGSPHQVFSEKLLPLLTQPHLDLLLAMLRIESLLASHAKHNSISGS